MNGPLAVLVAALLALAAVPVGVGAPAPLVDERPSVGASTSLPASVVAPVHEQSNWSNYLVLAGPTQQVGFQTVTIDVGGSLASDSTALHARYSANRVESSFESVRTIADQREAITTSANHIERRVAALETRQQVALSAYNDGDITARQFLRELAVVDRGARSLELAVSRLDDYNDELSPRAISSERIAMLQARLITLQGPVRQQVGQAMTGGDPIRVHIETSSNGIVLSAIVNGDRARYYREAYVPEHRDADGTDQWEGAPIEGALDRLSELYPWTYSNSQGLDIPPSTLYQVGVYRITITYPTGSPRHTLTTYLDGSTETAFREIQQQDLQTVRYRGTVERASGDLLIQVNRTYAGGPFEVQVRDNSTREPVEAAILVNGDSIGGTGSNGQRFALTPTTTFSVTAVHQGESVTVTVEPEPPS